MQFIIYILSFTAGIFLGLSLFFGGLKDEVSLQQIALFEADSSKARSKKARRIIALGRYLNIFAPLNRRIMMRSYRANVDKGLSILKTKLSALQFFTLKELFMIGLPLGVYLTLGKLKLVWVVVLAAVGFLLPDLWLRQQQRKRRQHIIRSLPEVIDLLSLCVSAGLDFMLAVRWVVEKSRKNPLIDELALVLQEIKMGRSRRDALKDMSGRLNIPDISSFVRTLIQADRIGSPVSETLAIISEDCRESRFRRGERLALQAPMKMLIPLIFCILPTVAIIVGGPVFLQFMQAGFKF
ncbi:MAG: type II secretion system F family protein [Candidatus Omnitrophota bacterium]